jgi:hypothetical protein
LGSDVVQLLNKALEARKLYLSRINGINNEFKSPKMDVPIADCPFNREDFEPIGN